MPTAGKPILALCQGVCAEKNCLCWQVVQVYVLFTEQDLSEVYQVPIPAAWPPLSRSSCSLIKLCDVDPYLRL